MTLGEHYLATLRRLVRLRGEYAGSYNELGKLLIDAAIVACVLECRDAGMLVEAHAVVTGG